jgi:hypothetical protein
LLAREQAAQGQNKPLAFDASEKGRIVPGASTKP